MKNQQEMFDILTKEEPVLYSKFSTVEARVGRLGEKIDTIINGELETTNTVKDPSAILKGPLGEQYIIPMEKFNKLYEGNNLNEEFNTFKAKGKVYAVKYEGKDLEFEASWGEKMIIKSGDMLVSPSKTEPGDVYRIEKNAFSKTYREDNTKNFSDKLTSALNNKNSIDKVEPTKSKNLKI